MYLNKAILSGNCAADPEIRDAVNGKKAASFRIGITERYKDNTGQFQEKTEWINIIAWGKTAEIAEKYVSKGSSVFIEGKIQNRQWTDQAGNKRYVTEVLASNIQVEKTRRAKQEVQDDDYDF